MYLIFRHQYFDLSQIDLLLHLGDLDLGLRSSSGSARRDLQSEGSKKAPVADIGKDTVHERAFRSHSRSKAVSQLTGRFFG